MPNELAEMDKQQPVELIPDFSYEDRHEFVRNLAYQALGKEGAPSRFTGSRLGRGGTSCLLVVGSIGLDYPICDGPAAPRRKIYR